MQWYVRSDSIQRAPAAQGPGPGLPARPAPPPPAARAPTPGRTARTPTWWTTCPCSAAYAANSARLGREIRRAGRRAAGWSARTDMGNVSYLVPSIHPMIKVAPAGVPIHTPDFAGFAVGRGRRPGRPRRRQGHGHDRRRPVGRRGRCSTPPGPSTGPPPPACPSPSDGPASHGLLRRHPRGSRRCRPSVTSRDGLRLGVVHGRGGGHPPAVLHQPRRPRVRPGQPARGRQGSAVRPLLAQRQEPAAALPRRVRRRARHRRRPDRRRHRRAAAGPRSSTSGCSSSTATTRWPSSAGSTWPASRPPTC